MRVRSGSNLAALVVEQKGGTDLKYKEEKFKQEVGPQQGYDLSKISSHYEHRRRLRRERMVLRYGEYVPLVAKTDNGIEERVLTYARYSLQETAIVATNLNGHDVAFYVDMNPLKGIYNKTYPESAVVMVTDWLRPDAPPQYYFLKELISLKQQVRLRSYTSTLLGLTICSHDSFVIKKALL